VFASFAGYIEYRKACKIDGGRRARNFNDLSSNISREVTPKKTPFKKVSSVFHFIEN